jgi:hypothetical protein
VTNDRAMVERALYARAERLADIDRRYRHRCYHCRGDSFVLFADSGPALCVNCQEPLAGSLRSLALVFEGVGVVM